MALQNTHLYISAEAFDNFVMQPENRQRSFELIGGEVVEVVSNGKSSALASRINVLVGGFVFYNHLGFTTTADGGYWINGERYIPDFAFVSKQKQARPTTEAYNSIPPDLAVEVLSPSNTPDEIAIKVDNYLRAGAVVWVINPDAERVTVHQPSQAPKTYTNKDTLDGNTVLPSFKLAVSDIFAE